MILCIDPGAKKAGASLWEPNGLFTGAWLGRGKDWIETADDVCKQLPTSAIRVSVVVIEKMQIYRDTPLAHANDCITLSLMAGRVAGLFPWAKTVEYYPSTWKGQVPKDIMIERIKAKLSHTEHKRVNLPRLKKGHADVWDAVGIGQYHLRTERRRLGSQESSK
jgi:hypothetical protein